MVNSFDSLGIGADHPCFMIAEISANHNHDLSRALEIVHAAHEAGADAIKLQTYTADTLTILSDREEFKVKGTIWENETLYSLYEKAYMPWEWHEPIMEEAARLGMRFLSTPFDFSAVDYLEGLEVDLFKVASSELVDIPLLRKVAQTGKPVILSTGMGTQDEVEEAVQTLREAGCMDLCILKCTAAYPARIDEANVSTIPHIAKVYDAIPGLSDHTMPTTVAIAAVALGAKVIEKHMTLRRSDGGPDATFSLEPEEFANLVSAVRATEASLGAPGFKPSPGEIRPRAFRRSLYVVKPVQKGEFFSAENLRSIRPAKGLHTRYYDQVLGTVAACDVEGGTPLEAKMLTIELATQA